MAMPLHHAISKAFRESNGLLKGGFSRAGKAVAPPNVRKTMCFSPRTTNRVKQCVPTAIWKHSSIHPGCEDEQFSIDAPSSAICLIKGIKDNAQFAPGKKVYNACPSLLQHK